MERNGIDYIFAFDAMCDGISVMRGDERKIGAKAQKAKIREGLEQIRQMG